MPVGAAAQSGAVSPSGLLAAYEPPLAGLDPRNRSTSPSPALVDQAARVWRRPGFDVMLSRGALHREPFEHPVRAAATMGHSRFQKGPA